MSTSITIENPISLQKPLSVLRDLLSRKTTWIGPAFIASVAYIDPGNFAANIAGGAQTGYSLLWVLLWGNAIAILIQTLSCRLGIFTGGSLASNCGKHMPMQLKLPLWITSEVMSVATDLAEVLGAGIGITLVFHIALFPACLIAGLISFLPFFKQKREQKFLEKLMLLSVLLVGAAFAYQVALAKPDWALVVQGILSPQLHKNSILIAASMLGATVMPHVVFLHSALMHTEEKFDDPEKRYKIAIADNFLALNFAWLINSAMVITFAAAYAPANNVDPTIESATKMLPPMLGGSAGFAFGWALIIAGLSSTTVGSMAGQVILDGFFKVRIPIWFRRLLTLLPCIVILHMGIDSTRLLVWSQAALSVALPFTIIPLIWLNSSTVVMGTRRLKGPLLLGSVVATGLVVGLNACLLITTLRSL